MNRGYVFVKLPKTGLGNMLLVWARGYVFAHKNQLPFFTSNWWSIRPGVWIRNEKRKRFYWGYFKNDSLINKLRLYFIKRGNQLFIEPSKPNISGKFLYQFSTCDTDGDYFKSLKPYRTEVKKALYALLTNKIRRQLDNANVPVIGMHIRRGDFKLGSALTPLQYFIDCLQAIRRVAGTDLPATIFSDADEDELKEILRFPGVNLSNQKADILDILLLSKSKICILSISSTFSFWAAFLSDGVILKHPDEWHPAIRPHNIDTYLFEGHFDPLLPIEKDVADYIMRIND